MRKLTIFFFICAFIGNANAQQDTVFDRLVWSDEFNRFGPLDDSKWHHQTVLPNGNSWFNGEVQHYTDRIDNSFTEYGFLKLIAKRETFTDQGVTKEFTSARLNSKFAFTYGRVVARAKMPIGRGTWPAIWMLGKNIIETGAYWTNEGFGTTQWPACGEIDIMEHWGNNQNYVSSAMHTPSSFGATMNHGGRVIPTVSSDFHVYEMIWTPEKITFMVDSIVHYEYNPAIKDASTWPFFEDQYIILNIALEANTPSGFQESEMVMDYIRVYQGGDDSTNTGVSDLSSPKLLSIFPNPAQNGISLSGISADGEASVQIYSTSGALMRTENLNSANGTINHLSVEELPAGMYLVLVNSDNTQQSARFIKE